MRAQLLLTAILLVTAHVLTPARADEGAPLPEALKTLLQEERFAKRAKISKAYERPDAYSLSIRPGSRRPPYDGLDANEIGRLMKTLDGVKIAALSYTADPELLPLLGKLPGVERLTVRSGSGSVDDPLRKLLPLLPDLDYLRIEAAQLGNPGLEAIARLPKIRTLWILSEVLDDEGVQHLRNMRQLQHLKCASQGAISDAAFPVFAELSQLEDLSVAGQGITGSELGQLARLGKLRSLSIGAPSVTDDSLQHLAGCTQLRSLTLAKTQVTGRGVAALAPLKELRGLRLDSTSISDEAIAKLAQLPNLERLNLDSTNLTDAACAHISKLPNLKYLSMDSTYVTDVGVATLADCKNLVSLALAGCGLTDRCAGDLCKLKSLAHLDVTQTDMTPTGVQALRDGLGERCAILSGGTRDPNRQGVPKPFPVGRRRPM